MNARFVHTVQKVTESDVCVLPDIKKLYINYKLSEAYLLDEIY